ncbi:MAG: SH3 domain-containing protein [Oscillospiraceae bacterium]|jgi:uncharacterized protein YgiM (DUF1202 family)
MKKRDGILRRTSAILIAICMIASMPMGAFAQSEPTRIYRASVGLAKADSSGTATVNADYLYVREGPGTDNDVVGGLKQGDSVKVLENDGNWAKIDNGSGLQGYCNCAFLEISNMPVSAGKAGTVNADRLNVRSDGSMGDNVLFQILEGTQVTVLGDSGDWVQIQTSDGKKGYCKKEFLDIKDTAAGAPTETPPQNDNTGSNKTGTVNADRLNVRSDGKMGDNVLFQILEGTEVTVLNDSGDWVQIKTSEGKTGYCSKEYLTISGGSSSESGSSSNSGSSQKTGTVNADRLNVRSDGSMGDNVLFQILEGTQVTVLDDSGDWVQIKTSAGRTGYCSKEYLTISGGSSSDSGSSDNGNSGGTTTTTAKVTADVLNVRSGDGTNYPVDFKIFDETVITVLEQLPSGWAKIQTNSGDTGYCSMEFLTLINGGESTPPDSGSNTTQKLGIVTGSDVRLREGPGTNYDILTTLGLNTQLVILDTSTEGWVKVQTSNNQTGYMCSDYVKEISDSDSAASDISLSNNSASVEAGKTLYIKASVTPSDSVILWTSSNEEIASVVNGYIYAKAPGNVTITAKSGTHSVSCNVTVKEADAVRSAYANPNVVMAGKSATLVAITDSSRTGVQFTMDGKTYTASLKQTDTTNGIVTKVWTAQVQGLSAGTHPFTAASTTGGEYTNGYQSDVFVSAQSDTSVTTQDDHRMSEPMLEQMEKWEGYASAVYADQLTYDKIPTVGYGIVLYPGDTFYNNLSAEEAHSQMVNSLNKASYTSVLNQFVHANNLYISQSQADALLSFSYNCGSGYFSNMGLQCDFRTIMLNAVDVKSGNANYSATATDTVKMYASVGGNQCGVLSNGTSITVTGIQADDPKNVYYKVQTSNGEGGWVNAGYVHIDDSYGLKKDLNYTNAKAMGNEFLLWCTAGGNAYEGLMYRRLGEVNVYNYNEYDFVRYNNHGYVYPSALQGQIP